MKIAFVTDDGKSICQHFGRASKYLVIDIKDGKEISRDLREKLGHSYFHSGEAEHDHSHDHNSPQNHEKHIQMMVVIEDCDVVVCGGMGRGAFMSITSLGKQVLVTDRTYIESALNEFQAEKLENMMDLIH